RNKGYWVLKWELCKKGRRLIFGMRKSSQRKGTLRPSIFNRSRSTQGKQHHPFICGEEGWRWASCGGAVVAAKSERGSGELLKVARRS
ncbi:hypothetical protein VIGAN_05004100, partial [Vigna angularis var. angularis]